MTKKSKGRQKIQMKRMEKESNLLVTFSKRRSGLFKKASKLSILCRVEITVVVFSPGKKVFSFSHPSMEMIVDHFFAQNPPPNSSTSQLVEAHRNANIHELNTQLACVSSQLEVEKNKSDQLSYIRQAGQETHWWEALIESLQLEGLDQLKVAMGMLHNNIEDQKKIRLMEEPPANLTPTVLESSSMNSGMTPHGFGLRYGLFNL